MTVRVFRVLWPCVAMFSAISGCAGEVADAGVGATDPTTGGSPTSFTPTSSDEPPTEGASTEVSTGTTDEPDGTTGWVGCGNGLVEADEECDDGADNGVSADCTDECRVHVCGDGKLHAELEECDDGPANVDTGACRSDCVLNVCGDGLVHAGVEECDVGGDNGPMYGGCDEACTVNRCGDGELDVGHEQCDDGELNGSGDSGEGGMAGCGTDCGFAGRRLFLSSKLFTGDMGSRAGADLACQNMAEDAEVPHPKQFRALLADSSGSPNDLMAEDVSGLPFIAPSGQILAADYAALIDLGPGTGMNVTETGEFVMDWLVWTNVGPFGDAFDTEVGSACGDWKSADGEKSARLGLNAVAEADLPEWREQHQWLSYATKTCDNWFRIYCIELPLEG